MMYLEIFDKWNVESSLSNIHLQIDTITNIASRAEYKAPNLDDFCWWNVFGTMIIRKGESKTWRLKLLAQPQDLCLAITATSNVEESKDLYIPNQPDSYGLALDNGYKYSKAVRGDSYADTCNVNDIILMTLDMTGDTLKGKGTVSYKINEQDFGVAFEVAFDVACCVWGVTSKF